MTMAHAVEARVPYLDHRVVEYAMRIPQQFKLRRTCGKYILRQISRTVVPNAITRRRKAGFSVPIAKWAKTEMQDMLQDLLGESSTNRRGLFDSQTISGLRERSRYSIFERRQLWSIICLEMWCRTFLD